MRIGVVSDTHDRIDNVGRLLDLLADEAVAGLVHTGDITRPATLSLFARLAVPVVGVLGNNDHDVGGLLARAAQLDFRFEPEVLQLEWAGRSIAVVHDPAHVTSALGRGHDVLLHGHTHRRTLEHRDGTLWFNPGESAGSLAGRNAVGILDLETLAASLLPF